MISYTFKITFDDIDDVQRIVEILSSQTFEDLHQAIQQAIGFDASKGAAFYSATDNWRKVKELNHSEKEGAPALSSGKLSDYIYDPHQKFIYVSDFEAEWTLLVELMKIQKSDATKTYPVLIKKVGEAPKQYENLNKYIQASSEFDAMADELIADRMHDEDGEFLDGETSEDKESMDFLSDPEQGASDPDEF